MKAYNLNKAAKRIGISTEDCIDYLKGKHYIYPDTKGYRATIIGIQNGYVVNINKQACLTTEGISKVASFYVAMENAVEEGKQLIAKYGLSVNNWQHNTYRIKYIKHKVC